MMSHKVLIKIVQQATTSRSKRGNDISVKCKRAMSSFQFNQIYAGLYY